MFEFIGHVNSLKGFTVCKIFASERIYYLSLRVDSDSLPNLKYFECDSLDIADVIKENLANKRFPIEEENVFNVSDPGESWWFSDEGDTFKIYFKLSRTEKIHQFTKLGPLGDTVRFSDLFLKLQGYFQKIFPVADYASGSAQVLMSSAERDNVNFRSLKHLFKSGEVTPELFDFLKNWEMSPESNAYKDSLQKANYILIELATIRSFWLEIENDLNLAEQI